ncbi:hypothetical protein DDZ18_08895 [Marinicauda salina]|uniref:Metallo-beta-lactamase domain-containing protein n=1 Tax=Marinicauda salina TaxID=2135793 RepID=A0A2U2BUQ4_9PROT|nr:MBL fold metallo-hydrolase [Marinicauda salina]PWE17761.1 hypothetical protein DDZ18_08895 [Marinicauda salina]
MKLTFLGTRANIAARNDRHRRHSALLVEYAEARLMIDCGADWLGRVGQVRPHAIAVTHAHPDHAFGLEDGAPCPVYATPASRAALEDFAIADLRTVRPRAPETLAGITFEAFEVVHSIRAPAVGYRIEAGRAAIFYVPDVVDIVDRDAALAGLDVYVGDGSSLTRPLVRRRGEQLFGHTTIRAQLGWCAEAGVDRTIFTHCGSQIVEGDERTLRAELRRLARERGVGEARFAHDGMTLVL